MRKELGFTLLELITAMTVVGVLLAIAFPSFSTMVLNNRSQAQGEELVSAINYTRSEAVKRGSRVSICASNDGGTGCGGDWTNGLLVFTDNAASDVSAAVVVGTVLKHWEAFHEDSNINATRGGGVNFVRFTSQGLLGRIGGSTDEIVFTANVTGCENNNAREITIGVAGMVKVARTDCT